MLRGLTTLKQVWHVDMASHESVERFARKASTDLERIDGFVANAGMMIDQWAMVEGTESSITVNVVNTLLLGVLIMPKLTEVGRRFDIKPSLVFIVSVLGYTMKSELDKSRTGSVFDGLNDREKANMDNR